MKYVVYITHYHGNKMPPFYIGKTTRSKVSKGYNGSVSSKKYKVIWGQERKDHPELFETKVLSHHETDFDARAREESLQRFYGIPNNPSFINQAITNKVFGGSPNLGKPMSEETKKKLRGQKRSEETKEKLRKPKSEEHKRKNRESRLGKKLTKEHCLNISISNKGKHSKPFSDEVKAHMSAAAFKRSIPIICPHCGFLGKGGIVYRWHFDNCPSIKGPRPPMPECERQKRRHPISQA